MCWCRIRDGRERENYGVNYRATQQAIAAEVPEKFVARKRAYLLLKHHDQETCKRTKPKCEKCPLSANCAFFAGSTRGGGPMGVIAPDGMTIFSTGTHTETMLATARERRFSAALGFKMCWALAPEVPRGLKPKIVEGVCGAEAPHYPNPHTFSDSSFRVPQVRDVLCR